MPRKRDPRRDRAFDIWMKSNKEMKLKDIAADLGVSDTLLRKWKSEDKWEDESVTKQRIKSNVTNKKDVTISKDENNQKILIDEDTGLTDKQRLFCIYYVKNFNATMAAIKAGYSKDSAHVEGSRLLSNAKVAKEIKRIKGKIQNELFIDEMDIVNRYIKIAFADINDYINFGNIEETHVIENEETGDQEIVKQKKNKIILKNSDEVDGSLITEIKTSRQGVSIKLEDRQKALDWLANFFDLNPEHKYKREFDAKKIQLEKERFEHQKKMDATKDW